MKKYAKLLLMLMAACSILQFVGCEKQDEVQVLVDTNPTPVYFVVKDAEGNNLLDVDYDGNILNNDIEITVLEIKGDQVKLGISAPKTVPVYRKEVYVQIQESNASSANIDALKKLKGI